MSDDHDLRLGLCPTCQRRVRVDVVSEHKTNWSDLDGLIHGADRFWILECRGCERIYFGHGSTFSENVDYQFNESSREWTSYFPEDVRFYPKTVERHRPEWTKGLNFRFSEVSPLLNEVYKSLDHDLKILAAIGIRSLIEAIARHLKLDTKTSFRDTIEEMRKAQYITGRDRDFLEILSFAGGSAAHAGWQPKDAELSTMMDIIEGTIHRAIILPDKARKLSDSVPSRPAITNSSPKNDAGLKKHR